MTEDVAGTALEAMPARRQRALFVYFAWSLVAAGLWIAVQSILSTFGMTVPPAAEIDAVQNPVGAFFVRLLNQPFQVGMAILFVGTILYALWQYLAVGLDCRNVASRQASQVSFGNSVVRITAAAAGRPGSFWAKRFEEEEARAHSKYGAGASTMPLRLALWMFPMLGFLGTVIGLSAAINRLSGIMGRHGEAGDQEMQRVLGELHLAFDTTIQGIVCAMAVIFLLAGLERMWLDFEEIAGEKRN